MKVSELIETLKTLPQDLEVFGPAEDSDYDYQPVMKVFVEKDSVLIDEDMEEEPPRSDICVISVRE
jgi:hypothetical protein